MKMRLVVLFVLLVALVGCAGITPTISKASISIEYAGEQDNYWFIDLDVKSNKDLEFVWSLVDSFRAPVVEIVDDEIWLSFNVYVLPPGTYSDTTLSFDIFGLAPGDNHYYLPIRKIDIPEFTRMGGIDLLSKRLEDGSLKGKLRIQVFDCGGQSTLTELRKMDKSKTSVLVRPNEIYQCGGKSQKLIDYPQTYLTVPLTVVARAKRD